MILLEQICQKLDNIFNGVDNEITQNTPINDKYSFKVYSEGLYLSTIADKVSGKNFIPVIVGALGGEYNPVPELEEADYNVQVQLLFPVRFKSDFYALNEFLVNTFVGKTLTYGTQKALSNISVAQYGELQDFNLTEFNQWITNTYKITTNYIKDIFMSMTFTLYLSTAKNLNEANGFIYGNAWQTAIKVVAPATATYNRVINANSQRDNYDTEHETNSVIYRVLSYKISGADADKVEVYTNPPIIIQDQTKLKFICQRKSGVALNIALNYTMTIEYEAVVLEDTTPAFITETDISNAEPASEQVLGEFSAKGFASSTSYSKELPIYIKNNTQYGALIGLYYARNLQKLKIILTDSLTGVSGGFFTTYTKTYYIVNLSFLKAKGEFLGLTFTLADSL